jgi:hypothetical protein
MLPMSSPDRNAIRLVVQLVQDSSSPHPGYRVVAYPAPKGMKLRPATFSSRDQLLQSLRTALPDFDPQILTPGNETQVLFAQELELTSAQLSILGLVQ